MRRVNGSAGTGAPPRREAALGKNLSARLKTYGLAAGAAGAGLLAAAQPAKADVVFTPANVTLTNGSLDIDLNHDGINDFVLLNDRARLAIGRWARKDCLHRTAPWATRRGALILYWP